jgi:hypothetical protein
MATSPNPPSRSDIGPISDTTSLGEPGGTPAARVAAASSRQAPPDAGQSEIETETEPTTTDETSQVANGAVPSKSNTAASTEEPATTATTESKSSSASDTSFAGGQGEDQRGMGKPWPALDYSQAPDGVEKQLHERMLARYGTNLVNDMEDAQYLLSYVTRNGLDDERKVTEETIQTVIAAREHMRTLTFDSQKEEAPFRKCCGVLAKAAEPVTAASLRDSFTKELYRPWLILEPRLKPVAEIACRRYRALALLILVFLLGFQIYWTACSTVLNKTDALISEINKAPSREYYISQEIARADALKAATDTKQSADEPSSAPSSSSEGGSTAVVSLKQDKTQLTRDELVSKIAELNANYSMLDKFMLPFRWLYFVPNPPAAQSQPTPAPQPSATRPPATASQPTSPPNPSPTEAQRTNGQDPDAIFRPSEFQTTSASIRAVASQVVEVMQKWLLPLLYGALGASVFVIRTLSVQARDRLFRREALVSLVLRVFLGMISGLAIGWFWNQNPAAATAAGPVTVTTLSPFALAFVAGYGVELFFALLDKIVSTFTNKA